MGAEMQRLLIGKSLRHIAEVCRSDWRMFIAIGWLPLALMGVVKLGWHYSLPYPKEWLNRPSYVLETALSVYSALNSLLDAVIIIGIYRYLLKDSRFRIKHFS